MFGRRKKNKDPEAADAFGQSEQPTANVTVTASSTQHSGHVVSGAAGATPDLGGLLGALHEAMEESGGDPDKLADEIKENLSERGIAAEVTSSDGPTVITSGFGGLVSPEDATLARLEKLGQLKAQGLLTEEEFATQKARILGS